MAADRTAEGRTPEGRIPEGRTAEGRIPEERMPDDRAVPSWRRQIEAADNTAMGGPPENRRQALGKLAWIGLWMLYLGSPVSDLASGRHTAAVTVAAAVGLTGFVGGYLALVFW